MDFVKFNRVNSKKFVFTDLMGEFFHLFSINCAIEYAFGPNLTYSESFKGRVRKKAVIIKKIPLIFETPPEFLLCCRGSSTV
jgi:hypothetical protein